MENIFLLGTNHQHAPIEWRERIAIKPEKIGAFLQVLHKHSAEVVILATCNRLEIYGIALDGHTPRQPIIDILVQTCGISEAEIEKYFYTHSAEAAVRHLFTVAAGLDSMLVGEAQILGQV